MIAPRSLLLFATAASFTLTFTSAHLARAQTASSQAAAQALFDEGRKLMAAGKYSDACPKLAESQKLDPGPGTLINLAACYEKNGQTASAWATYKEAISESEKSNRAEWATRARQRAAAIEPTLSRMIVTVPAAARTAGLTVRRDGVEVGQGEWGVPIPVDPGSHILDAAAPGKKPWSTRSQVGQSKDTVTVTIPALEAEPVAAAPAPVATPAPGPSAPPPAPIAPEPSKPSTQRTIGFVVAGAGIVGLGVGAVFGLVAMGKRSDAETNCNADLSKCNADGINDVNDAKSMATISTIGFIAGGALAVGGVALILTAPKSERAASTGSTRFAFGNVGSGFGATFGGDL